MFLGLIRHVEPVWLVQRSLLVWIDVDVTLNALLASVRPAVSTHPFAFAQRAFEFSETPLLPLVWSEAFAFRSGLKLEQGRNNIKEPAERHLSVSLCAIKNQINSQFQHALPSSLRGRALDVRDVRN